MQSFFNADETMDEFLDSASTDGQDGGVEELRELFRFIVVCYHNKLYLHRNNNGGGGEGDEEVGGGSCKIGG